MEKTTLVAMRKITDAEFGKVRFGQPFETVRPDFFLLHGYAVEPKDPEGLSDASRKTAPSGNDSEEG